MVCRFPRLYIDLKRGDLLGGTWNLTRGIDLLGISEMLRLLCSWAGTFWKLSLAEGAAPFLCGCALAAGGTAIVSHITAAGLAILSGIPYAKHGNGRRLFGIRRQDFIVQFIPACKAHPAVHFAGGWAVITVNFLAKPMKVVLSEAFRFVQQRIDDFASGGGVVELPAVVRDSFKV